MNKATLVSSEVCAWDIGFQSDLMWPPKTFTVVKTSWNIQHRRGTPRAFIKCHFSDSSQEKFWSKVWGCLSININKTAHNTFQAHSITGQQKKKHNYSDKWTVKFIRNTMRPCCIQCHFVAHHHPAFASGAQHFGGETPTWSASMILTQMLLYNGLTNNWKVCWLLCDQQKEERGKAGILWCSAKTCSVFAVLQEFQGCAKRAHWIFYETHSLEKI